MTKQGVPFRDWCVFLNLNGFTYPGLLSVHSSIMHRLHDLQRNHPQYSQSKPGLNLFRNDAIDLEREVVASSGWRAVEGSGYVKYRCSELSTESNVEARGRESSRGDTRTLTSNRT